MHPFELTKSYDLVYYWFNILKNNKIEIIAYVIMLNHVHCILYFPKAGFNLDKLLSNGKRFIAYEIVNRLELADWYNFLRYHLFFTLNFQNNIPAITPIKKPKGPVTKIPSKGPWFDVGKKIIGPKKPKINAINPIAHPPISIQAPRFLRTKTFSVFFQKKIKIIDVIINDMETLTGTLWLMPCISKYTIKATI